MEKIVPEEKPNDIPLKFDCRYVFPDTITRASQLVGEEKEIERLIMSTQLPYVFTDEPIPLEFDYELTYGFLKDLYTKIIWQISHKNIPSPILITFQLTENTVEKTVLVIFEIEFLKRELIPEQYYEKINNSFPKICCEMIQSMEKELEEYNKYIYHYESKIFNYPIEKIWNVIMTFHLKMFEEGVIKNLTLKTPIKEECEFSFNMCGDNNFCKMKVNKIKCEKNSNKWVVSTTPLNGPFAHYIQEWIFIKLGEKQTFITNNSNYKEQISPDNFNKITEQKRFTFKLIEDILKFNNFNNQKKIIDNYIKENHCSK